jgi:threonine dehydrogenase-like Zn-dependent dehydrogenase
MKAVGYKTPLPIADPQSLLDIEVPVPVATGRDLLVEIKAISVNPVDVKVRASGKPDGTDPKILGWDAAGIVKAIGRKRKLSGEQIRLPRRCLGNCGRRSFFKARESPRQRLGNLNVPTWICKVEASHVLEVALGEPAAEVQPLGS